MYYILIDEVQYAITKDELKNPENIGFTMYSMALCDFATLIFM